MAETDYLAEPFTTVLRKLFIDNELGTDLEGVWPIFEGFKPDSPDSCIVLIETASVSQGRYMTGPRIRKYGCSVQLRTIKYTTGDDKSRSIAKALTETISYPASVTTEDSNEFSIHNVEVASGPLYIGPEPETRRNIWTLNLLVPIRPI